MDKLRCDYVHCLAEMDQQDNVLRESFRTSHFNKMEDRKLMRELHFACDSVMILEKR